MIFVCDALPSPPPPPPTATATVAIDVGGSVGLQAEWNMSLNKLNIEIIVGPLSALLRIRCIYVAHAHTHISAHKASQCYIIFLKHRKLVIFCFSILFDACFVWNACIQHTNLKCVNFQSFVCCLSVARLCLFIYSQCNAHIDLNFGARRIMCINEMQKIGTFSVIESLVIR